MLDVRCQALLGVINGECGGSGYKIFETEFLKNSLPKDCRIDEDGIRECIKLLSERDYISVKYQDDKEICLSPLAKGRLVNERRIDEQIERNSTKRQYLIYSFFGAIIGSILGGVITAIIFFFGGR